MSAVGVMLDYHRRIRAALLELGATQVVLERRRKHPRFHFTLDGQARFVVVAWSPGDWRATAQAIAGVRRLYRQAGPR